MPYDDMVMHFRSKVKLRRKIDMKLYYCGSGFRTDVPRSRARVHSSKPSKRHPDVPPSEVTDREIRQAENQQRDSEGEQEIGPCPGLRL